MINLSDVLSLFMVMAPFFLLAVIIILVRHAAIPKITNAVKNKRHGKCPKCGGNLVEKSGKYGKFVGCSNYPTCQYTEDI